MIVHRKRKHRRCRWAMLRYGSSSSIRAYQMGSRRLHESAIVALIAYMRLLPSTLLHGRHPGVYESSGLVSLLSRPPSSFVFVSSHHPQYQCLIPLSLSDLCSLQAPPSFCPHRYIRVPPYHRSWTLTVTSASSMALH